MSFLKTLRVFSFLITILTLLLLSSIKLEAQGYPHQLALKVNYNGDSLRLNHKYYSNAQQDSFTVNKLRFYISNMQLLKNDNPLASAIKKHQLIDIEKPESMNFILDHLPDFDQIRFEIGVDSLTNSNGAHGEDLDPVHGMYWTWNSGYINFKLEGTSPKCDSRNNAYQFHIGGFIHPYNSIRSITLNVPEDADLNIILDLDRFISQLNFKEQHTIMSPSKTSMEIADLLTTIFSVE